VSRLCRPASFGLAIIAPSRGVESPVPTGVHARAWTQLDECCENPPEKKIVAFGADEPNSSEPAKGLKEGVCQMWGGGYGVGWVEKGGGILFLLIFLIRFHTMYFYFFIFIYIHTYAYIYIYIYSPWLFSFVFCVVDKKRLRHVVQKSFEVRDIIKNDGEG